jgi:hypothetical protein
MNEGFLVIRAYEGASPLRTTHRLPVILAATCTDCTLESTGVKYTISSLETNSAGVKLIYYEKNNLLTLTIPWNKLEISKGSTFTKSASRSITIKNDSFKIASFYADSAAGISNNEINELYNNLEALKLANIEI